MARIIGYSDRSAEELLASTLAGEPAVSRSGDYTAVVDRRVKAPRSQPGSTRVERFAITAPIAAFPVYAARDSSGEVHVGDNVFSVASAAGLAWDWNVRAVRCLALFGHTLGRDSLHPLVNRLPPDTLFRYGDRGVVESSLGFWARPAETPTRSTQREALAVLRQALVRDTRDRSVLLSLSAGYDSRLLLALCLAEGLRPRCVTMGPAAGTDAQVAAHLARKYDLPHSRIELDPADYLAHGPTSTRLTSGSKTAGNWHTYLYSRAAAGSSEEVHLVGSNGEYARSFYFPNAATARVASHLPGRAISAYFLARIERRRRRFHEWGLIAGPGAMESAHIALSTTNGEPDLATALDTFYATERVRHFIGNGLALYASVGRPRAPFLEAAAVDAIRRLPRSERVDNVFHVSSIRALDPSLAEIPFNRPLTGRASALGYSPFSSVRTMPGTRDVVMECPLLDSLVPRHERESLLARASDASFELLLTLAFAARAAGDEPSVGRRTRAEAGEARDGARERGLGDLPVIPA